MAQDVKIELEDVIELLAALDASDGSPLWQALIDRVFEESGNSSDGAARIKAILGILLARKAQANTRAADPATVTAAPDGTQPLTPINAALGQTIGRLLNGKKSATGVVGLLVTVMLPALGIDGNFAGFLEGNRDTLLTLFSVIAGWGMFGKLDKAIRLMEINRRPI